MMLSVLLFLVVFYMVKKHFGLKDFENPLEPYMHYTAHAYNQVVGPVSDALHASQYAIASFAFHFALIFSEVIVPASCTAFGLF